MMFFGMNVLDFILKIFAPIAYIIIPQNFVDAGNQNYKVIVLISYY